MNLNSPIDSTLLQNKFLNLVVVSVVWDFGCSRDWKGSDSSGIRGKCDALHSTNFIENCDIHSEQLDKKKANKKKDSYLRVEKFLVSWEGHVINVISVEPKL